MMAMTMSAQTIFEEDFEGVAINPQTGQGAFPTGWVTYADDLTPHQNVGFLGNSWIVASLQSGGQVAASASRTNENQNCDRWLVTPKLNINLANAQLTFFLGGGSGDAPETTKIMVSTTNNEKASFSEVQTYTNVAMFKSRIVDLSAYENQEIYIAFVNVGNGVYTMLDDIFVGVVPSLSMEMISANVPNYVGQNMDATIGGKIVNTGVENITSFDAYFEVDGVVSATTTVTGINVPYAEEYEFTIDQSFNSSELGSHQVNVFVENINGDESVSIENNTMSGNIMVYDATQTSERTVLLEHFTTGQCRNCPAGDVRIEAAVGNRSDVIWMAHHAGFYTDVMTIPEHEELTVFFGPMGTYAPGIMLDRTHMDPTEPGPVFFPGDPSDISNKINAAKEVPAFGSVEITSANFNAETRELSINVTGMINENFVMDSRRLSVYLVEDSVLAPQAGVQGKKHHMHVMRDAITDVWGEELAEPTFDKSYTFTVPEKFKAHRCKVVAFISNYSQDINNCKVINADQTEYLNAPYVGIEEVGSNVVMNVYPNPAINYAKIEASSAIRDIRIVNALGQEVYVNSSVNAEEVTINTESLSAGMYVVTIKTDDGVAVRRMSVAR